MTNGLGLGNAYSYCETKGGIKGKDGKKHEARCGYDTLMQIRNLECGVCTDSAAPLNCDSPK